jgi:3-oxocholest-4-en-26-oate---CoA ligase
VGIVGDAFARPMLAALDREPGRWDLTSLRTIRSAGAMFSEPIKAGLLAHLPSVRVVDQFGSSESGTNVGVNISAAGSVAATGAFRLGRGTRVVTEDDRDVLPGSGEAGMVLSAIAGPEGYYKDPDKTAALFRVIDGKRYVVTGDYATVAADGTLRVLGRGSVCINTGGEKVFPEEVEESLKMHPAIRDAVVVGVPDERFGEVIAAVIEEASPVADGDLITLIKTELASYKAPRHIVRVTSIGRTPSGKADYPATRRLAIKHLSATDVPA